jgi:hypothetical protein
MPDNELDDLFRKAAGEYNAEFEPEAWKRMEQLLDERDGRTGGYWWKGILMLLALLLVGTLGFVLLRKPGGASGTAVTENRQPGTTTAPAGADGPAEAQRPAGSNAPAGSDLPARGNAPEAGTRPEKAGRDENATAGKRAPEPRATKGQPTGDEATTGDAGNRENAPGETPRVTAKRGPSTAAGRMNGLRPGRPAGLVPGKQQRLASRGERAVRTNTNARNTPPGATGGATERTPPGAFGDDEPDRAEATADPRPGEGPANAVLPAGERLPEFAFLTGKLLAATPPEFGRPVVPPPAVPEGEKQPVEPVAKPKPPAGRLSAGVMVSPDLSSIGLSGRLTPGTNVGVQLEYRLTNRFRVGVGAIHSVKLYSAGVEDYKVPYGFWTYGVAPSGIDANCKVLDLPVHLRFDAVRRARYNAFVSTGLSSYIMLSERYGYRYPTYNPYLRSEWRGKRTGEHYFSVVNLSVGYERNLGRRFSWQAEPFLKLPLGGVGFGKVRLATGGVFVSVKYRMGKPNN